MQIFFNLGGPEGNFHTFICMDTEEMIRIAIDKSVKIHKKFGPGLVERFYEILLYRELRKEGIRVARQVPIDMEYEGVHHTHIFRVDILMDRKVIIEVKSSRYMSPLFSQQLLTYLKATNLKIGILLNFGKYKMQEGIKRVVNGYEMYPKGIKSLQI